MKCLVILVLLKPTLSANNTITLHSHTCSLSFLYFCTLPVLMSKGPFLRQPLASLASSLAISVFYVECLTPLCMCGITTDAAGLILSSCSVCWSGFTRNGDNWRQMWGLRGGRLSASGSSRTTEASDVLLMSVGCSSHTQSRGAEPGVLFAPYWLSVDWRVPLH